MLIGYKQMKRCRSGSANSPALFDGSCNSEGDRVSTETIQNYPAEARKLVRPAFVWSDYCWKEAGEIVERFIGGFL